MHIDYILYLLNDVVQKGNKGHMNFSDIILDVKKTSMNNLILKQNDMAEEKRLEEYKNTVSKYKKRGEIADEYTESIIETYFEWTQCKDPSYNKNYIKLLENLKCHIDEFEKVYNLLGDDISKEIFTNILMWRLTRRSCGLIDSFLSSGVQYFENIERLNRNEVLADCGGYTGDTIETLLKCVGGMKRVYMYEPNEENIEQAKKNLKDCSNIVYRKAGVGSRNIRMSFSETTLSSTGTIVEASGDMLPCIDIVRIDDDIKEKITFIKMDIEGMEMEALIGAERHIVEDRPVLAVCVYHKPEDLYEIPLYINKMVNDYSYYIRHYTLFHGETVLYAVPNEREL